MAGKPLQSIDKVDALPSKACKQSFDCSPRALRCACARVSGGNPRITRPQPIFDGRPGTSICCKMAFSVLTGQKTLILRPQIDIGSNILLPALGYRPAFAENDPLDHFPGASAPGDVHALGCRPASTENHPLDDFPRVSAPADYNRRTCGPFDASQGFVDSLTPGLSGGFRYTMGEDGENGRLPFLYGDYWNRLTTMAASRKRLAAASRMRAG